MEGESKPLLGGRQPKEAARHGRLYAELLPSFDGVLLSCAFALMHLGTTCHRAIFTGYHMNMYLSVYGLSAMAVARVHLIFGVWNPINDLLGAWCSDSFAAKHGGSRIWLLVALLSLWPLFTVLPFVPQLVTFLGPSLAALLFLCAEDTVFSFAAIAQGALWTDCTAGESERLKISRLENLLHFAVIPLSSLSYARWTAATEGGAGLGSFAQYAAAMGAGGLVVCLLSLAWLAPLERRALQAQQRGAKQQVPLEALRMDSFLKNILRQRNFWLFCVASVLNEVQNTFAAEFSAILTDIYLRGSAGTSARSLYIGVENALMGAVGFVLSFAAQWVGVYRVFMWTLLGKCALCALLFFVPPTRLVGAGLLILTSVSTAGAMSFWKVLVASLVDEYRHLHGGRAQTLSVVSLLWGLHALCAKPCVSLAPIVGSAVLERAGWTGNAMHGAVTDSALSAAYHLTLGFPALLGAIQLLAWRSFDLHGQKLLMIQAEAVRDFPEAPSSEASISGGGSTAPGGAGESSMDSKDPADNKTARGPLRR